MLETIPLIKILTIIYGGIFGWVMGKLPKTWVYVILAAALLLTIVVLV
jgi:hypothetical protein